MTGKNKLLSGLFENWAGESAQSITMLPQSGSYREYYRVKGATKTAVGVYNADKKENIAFLSFTNYFLQAGLPVPQVYAEQVEDNVYLLQDLGDVTLYAMLQDGKGFNDSLLDVYKNVLSLLPALQIDGAKLIDYSVCYPRESFDRQSMMWDMNYFKYCFLKPAKVAFDEQLLENDFVTLADFLLSADCNYFLYRDLQSSNIMLCGSQPYFIDYQGGRKGSLHYDVASLLFDAKALLPHNVRVDLLNYYIEALRKKIAVDEKSFKNMYYGYVLIRIMQAMGAYGFRGLTERKELFLQSIPPAIDDFKWFAENVQLPVALPELQKVITRITGLKEYECYRKANA
jgi:aminoglycoside/choline kinase family phosphotransferase